jgi:hypothetical protein
VYFTYKYRSVLKTPIRGTPGLGIAKSQPCPESSHLLLFFFYLLQGVKKKAEGFAFLHLPFLSCPLTLAGVPFFSQAWRLLP